MVKVPASNMLKTEAFIGNYYAYLKNILLTYSVLLHTYIFLNVEKLVI